MSRPITIVQEPEEEDLPPRPAWLPEGAAWNRRMADACRSTPFTQRDQEFIDRVTLAAYARRRAASTTALALVQRTREDAAIAGMGGGADALMPSTQPAVEAQQRGVAHGG